MEANLTTDGIYAGRYVLIEYDTDLSKKIFTKQSTRQQKSDSIVLQIKTAFDDNKISKSKAYELLDKIKKGV